MHDPYGYFEPVTPPSPTLREQLDSLPHCYITAEDDNYYYVVTRDIAMVLHVHALISQRMSYQEVMIGYRMRVPKKEVIQC